MVFSSRGVVFQHVTCSFKGVCSRQRVKATQNSLVVNESPLAVGSGDTARGDRIGITRDGGGEEADQSYDP